MTIPPEPSSNPTLLTSDPDDITFSLLCRQLSQLRTLVLEVKTAATQECLVFCAKERQTVKYLQLAPVLPGRGTCRKDAVGQQAL